MKTKGFTLVEIMIVVLIIGLLAALAIPSFIKARETTQMNACINNLRQIDAAKEQWAMETGQVTGAACVAANVQPYIKGLVMPTCPVGAAAYLVDVIGTDPSCTSGIATHVLP